MFHPLDSDSGVGSSADSWINGLKVQWTISPWTKSRRTCSAGFRDFDVQELGLCIGEVWNSVICHPEIEELDD